MRDASVSRLVLAALLAMVFAVGLLAPVGAFAAVTAALAPGAGLPQLEARSLSGDPAVLPRDARGHGMVLVIGFTKSAAKSTRPWLEGCRALAPVGPDGSSAACYDIRMVEDVPRMFRGMMERSMKSGLPTELQRRTLLAYADNEAWRKRTGASDLKTAYVIGCDAEGVVRYMTSGSYSEPELKKVLGALEPKPPS